MSTTKLTTMLHKRTNKITRVLVYVVLEWTLIFLLLLNSSFSYFILKFAVYFGLKPPCLFCSRLDHALESHKSNKKGYKDFICESHAREISKYGYCSTHHKLVSSKNDVCNEEQDESEDDIQPLLSINNDDINVNDNDSLIVTTKGLCSEMLPQHLEFYIDHDDHRFIPIECNNNSEESKEKRENYDEKIETLEEVSREVDWVFEGDELKACCESGSVESDEKDEKNETLDEICKEVSWGFEGDELKACCEEIGNNLASNSEESEVKEKFDLERDEKIETLDEICDEHKGGYDVIGTNLASIQEEEEEEKTSLDEPSQCHIENCVVCEITPFSEGVVEDDCQEIRTENGVHLASTVCNDEIESRIRRDEIGEENIEKLIEKVLIEGDEQPGNDVSPTIADNGVCEVSATDENDAEVNERSLNINVGLPNNEIVEEKIPDTPNSIESAHLHKKLLFLGRRGSITEESLDGSIVSEHEGGDGDTLIEKLKLELQSEKKIFRVLYAELEEERNASATAANQTMAMINRLQEEKATMQMEALQYQRMMEEQSEYDQEALQMMNELMVKRENEKRELEKELEVYRKKLLDYEEREKVRILSRRMEGSMRSRNSSASCSYGEESDGLSIDLNLEVKDQEEERGVSPEHDTSNDAFLDLNDSLASFEGERASILEQLKVLEEKLFTLAEEEEEDDENTRQLEELSDENGKEFDDKANGCENGFTQVQKRLLPLFDEVELLESPNGMLQEKGHVFDLVGNKFSITKFELEKKRFAIEEEVDHVYGRLQALEADREFLKHCIGSLKKGDKGLDLLQEILQHLRDLKNVELHAMKNMDHTCASV